MQLCPYKILQQPKFWLSLICNQVVAMLLLMAVSKSFMQLWSLFFKLLRTSNPVAESSTNSDCPNLRMYWEVGKANFRNKLYTLHR